MSSAKTENPQEIPSFNFHDVTHEQLRSICEKVSEKWKKVEEKPVTIDVALQIIDSALPLHLKALYRSRGSEHTEILGGSDRNRDRANSQFFNKVMIAANEWDETVAEAGKELKEIIAETAGIGLNNLAYDVQTSKTDDLIEILSTSENLQKIETCGVVEDFNRLISFNKAFKESYENKVQDESDSEVVPPLKELTFTLKAEVRKILEDTEYLYVRNHPSVDVSLFNEIHTYVKDLVTLINKSK